MMTDIRIHLKSVPAADAPETHLSGIRLTFVRLLWMAMALTLIAVRIAAVLPRWSRIVQLVSIQESLDLVRLGISPSGYAWFLVVLELLVVLVYSASAGIIFFAKSDDWMALLASASMLLFGATIFSIAIEPAYQLALSALQMAGVTAAVLTLFLFPNGRFSPAWSRWVLAGFGVWLAALLLLPQSQAETSIESWSLPLQIFAQVIGWFTAFPVNSQLLAQISTALRTLSLVTVLVGWFGAGVVFQIHRYRGYRTTLERQQTKSIIFGIVLAFFAALFFYLPPVFIPALAVPGMFRLTFQAASQLIFSIFLVLVPIFILIAVLRYRLWQVDLLINRTMVYGLLTGILGILYFGSVFLLQAFVQRLTGQSSDVVIVLSTLATAALVRPLRARIQDFIDRRFYREKIDFRRAFIDFGEDLRTLIDLQELQSALVRRVTDLLHIGYGAVFLRKPDGNYECTYAYHTDPDQPTALPERPDLLQQLENGAVAYKAAVSPFPMLVPLLAPRSGGSDLVGVLALGPKLSGELYTPEDKELLFGLADQAGTAVRVARLIDEKQIEARQREEAEKQLVAHWNSPLGRAEAMAEQIHKAPEKAFAECHRLAQAAGTDASAAQLSGNLPKALESAGSEQIAGIAQGFSYLFASHDSPEVLPAGIRLLLNRLQPTVHHPIAEPERNAAFSIYAACLDGIQARAVSDIAGWNAPADSSGDDAPYLRDLVLMLVDLRASAEALRSYERVQATQDKLAYLASAIEKLGLVHHAARTTLGSADRPIIRRIAEHWMAIATGAMGELQTRAQIACELLTRHTWQGDAINLVLMIRNAGRGAALNLQVLPASSSEYSVMEPPAPVERLGPAEEIQVEMRVRPTPAGGANRFRVQFDLQFADPRGPDQCESFADVVHLLETPQEFQVISNPYVVGTPLQAGSPLFFGREDVLAFLRENLTASHRNNIVLIGQRRTGKSSLLKQLPARLGDDFLPVYLDGQALGLDPGMSAFFHAIATEIAFSLEDRGYDFPVPQLEDFSATPTASFERQFLPAVRKAIADRHILLLLDEFEELESSVRRGVLDPALFSFLRHLIQHHPKLSVVFCGTHRLEELTSDYWNILFNISLYRHIGFLSRDDAFRLIQEPVSGSGMRFDDLALDKIWRTSAGHPYFLQLICHNLVNRHNQTERSYVTVGDVNAALEDILTTGEAHFLYLWTESSPEQKLALFAQSRLSAGGQVTVADAEKYLLDRGAVITHTQLLDAYRVLTSRDILARSSLSDRDTVESFSWKLGLLGMWVEKSKSLGQVAKETMHPAKS